MKQTNKTYIFPFLFGLLSFHLAFLPFILPVLSNIRFINGHYTTDATFIKNHLFLFLYTFIAVSLLGSALLGAYRSKNFWPNIAAMECGVGVFICALYFMGHENDLNLILGFIFIGLWYLFGAYLGKTIRTFINKFQPSSPTLSR